MNPGKKSPKKWFPEKWYPGKKSPEKSWGERRALWCVCGTLGCDQSTQREFLREILYKNIVIIAIQRNKMYFVDTFGDFFHTVE